MDSRGHGHVIPRLWSGEASCWRPPDGILDVAVRPSTLCTGQPYRFLDYKGAEFVLIGSSADVSAELGIDLPAEPETELTADIFQDLKVEREEHPLTPLFKGEWQ